MQLDTAESSEKDVFFEQLREFEDGRMVNALQIRKLFKQILEKDMLDILPGYYKRIAVYLIREGHIKGSVMGKKV